MLSNERLVSPVTIVSTHGNDHYFFRASVRPLEFIIQFKLTFYCKQEYLLALCHAAFDSVIVVLKTIWPKLCPSFWISTWIHDGIFCGHWVQTKSTIKKITKQEVIWIATMVKIFKNHKSYSESLETQFGCEFFWNSINFF